MKIIKTLEAFHEKYKYKSIVIAIRNQRDLDDSVPFLNHFHSFEDIYKAIKFAGFSEGNQYYIRINETSDYESERYLSYDDMIRFEENSLDIDAKHERLFSVNDLKNGLLTNILKFGKSLTTPNYTPRKIERTLETYQLPLDQLLLEKSSLTKLGVPREVMQPIQRDFAIPADATWDRIRLKRDVENIFRNGEKELVLQIETDSIKAFGSFMGSSGMKYFIDAYIMEDSGWGGGYNKLEREVVSLTQLLYQINSRALLYHLKDTFSLAKQPKRKLIKIEKGFEEFTSKFKSDFLHDFNSILRRIVGSKYKDAKQEIRDKAKQIEIENQMMISGLDDPLAGPNSLTILDEFITQFEEAYSEFFGERLDIQELSKHFTREKMMTSFMYFIYTGKLLNR